MSGETGTAGLRERPLSNLTQSQFLIWSGQQMRPAAPLYNMAFRFDIRGTIDVDAFRRSFQALVTASDALRTVFVEQGGIPMQQVLDELDVPLDVVDLTTDEDPQAAARSWCAERSRQPFDLTRRCIDTALLHLGQDHFCWYLNQHHLTMDAWSSAIVFRQVAQRYADAVARNAETAAPLPAYADFVTYERELRETSDQADTYWQRMLAEQPARVGLYGRAPEDPGSDSHRRPCAFGAARSRRLRALAEQPGIRGLSRDLTLFNLFATLVFAYLWRLTGQPAQTLGTPAHNRSSLAFRETIGLFIEFFPLQVRLDDADSFRSLLAKVNAATQDYLRHARPGASTSATARAFNVVLNYIPVSFGRFAQMPTESTWLHAGSLEPDHALRIQVHQFNGGDELVIDFDCNDAWFSPESGAVAPQHLLALADAMLDDLDRPIAQVALATAAERTHLLSVFNPPAVSGRDASTVVTLLRAQARARPNAIAVRDSEIVVDFATLDRDTDRLAAELQSRGVTTDHYVGVFLERSVDLVRAVLTVLKAGAAFVPLDSRLPTQRLAFILDDTEARLVITQRVLRRHLPAGGPEVFEIDGEAMAKDTAIALPEARLDQPAYAIYTSGSTGNPKGVVVEHGALTDYVRWARDTFSDRPHPSYPLYSSFGFDLTLTSLFVPLISGGTIVVYREEDTPTDLSILRVFDEDRVDAVKLTPAHLRLVADRDLRDTRIQSLILGGEDLKTTLARRISNAAGGAIRIYNEYGPTECVVACMVHRFDPQHDRDPSVPIGKPATGNRIYVLDAGLNPVPTGTVGEIHIGGRLARGYLRRPDLTAERFVDDPFAPGQRMYRSGDLGRLRADGVLEYLGRNDDQLKVRGVRIEPAELEQALLQHPAIDACVLSAVASGPLPGAADIRYCARCGIASNHPGAVIDATGICNLCIDFDSYRERAQTYFHTLDELRALLHAASDRRQGRYDCLMLLSGGKDSTYALYQVASITPRVLAVTLDNGFVSDGAKANIARVVSALGIDHRYLRTDAMNAIFVDSLERHSNVCHGCFKTLYTLAAHTALAEGAPLIVTGLSRGQFFETRLTPAQFVSGDFDVAEIDRTVLAARKAYHRIDDAVARLLDVEIFRDDHVFEQIQFVDFYRYCDVSLDDLYAFLAEHAPWIRPADTGRSTNCLINDAGIYMHKNKEGYHNYALPYSWDVRLGHKERDAALDELNDTIDVPRVHRILQQIGYREPAGFGESGDVRLVAHFTASESLSAAALRDFLGARIPAAMIPSEFIQLDRIPLTANGKVDRDALPVERSGRPPVGTVYRAPDSDLERALAEIWRGILRAQRVGVDDNFFDLGGDSLSALQIVARANDDGIPLTAALLFHHQTVAELAQVLADAKPAVQDAQPATHTAVATDELAKLATLLGKS